MNHCGRFLFAARGHAESRVGPEWGRTWGKAPRIQGEKTERDVPGISSHEGTSPLPFQTGTGRGPPLTKDQPEGAEA